MALQFKPKKHFKICHIAVKAFYKSTQVYDFPKLDGCRFEAASRGIISPFYNFSNTPYIGSFHAKSTCKKMAPFGFIESWHKYGPYHELSHSKFELFYF